MIPRISVVLPYRNAESTLKDAIESVLAERSVPIEVLAIDDGSSDRGAECVAALSAQDARLRPLRAEGCGIVAALSQGVIEARAPLIARMDADDVSLIGRFEAQLQMMEGERLSLVGTRVHAFPLEAVGEGLARYIEWQNALITPNDHRRSLFVESPLCHPSVLIDRKDLLRVGGYRPHDGPEDYELFLRFRAHGLRMGKVGQVFLNWRHRSDRLTFTDARYSPEAFRKVRAAALAPLLREETRRLVSWGAGPIARRLARALEDHGIVFDRFLEIDPRRIGGIARGRPIVGTATLELGLDFVVVAVGARGARDLIRAELTLRGFEEERDFLCAA